MRVKMHITYYGADKKQLSNYAQIKDRKFFRFELRTCNQEVVEDMGSYRLQDEQYGTQLSSSELLTIKEGTTYNHSFGNETWGYNDKIGIFLYVDAINI